MPRPLAFLLLLPLAAGCRKDKAEPGDDPFELSEVEDEGSSLDPDDTGEPAGGDDSAETGETDDTGDTSQPDTQPDRMTMGGKQVLSTIVTDPSGITSNQETATTTSWVLVAWERTGTAVRWTETLCGIESSEVFSTTTSFPDAFIDTMPVRERQGSLSSATTGATLSGGPFVDLVSVDLDNPDSDRLPEDPDDDAVQDQDGDGEPGVTVIIDNAWLGDGEAHVIQRNTSTYDGVIISSERVEGYLDAETEQVILSASTWWLELETEPPEPDPDATHSYFVLQKMDDDADCADLLREKGSLF